MLIHIVLKPLGMVILFKNISENRRKKMNKRNLKFQILYSWMNFIEAFIGLITLGFYYPSWTIDYVFKKAGRKKSDP